MSPTAVYGLDMVMPIFGRTPCVDLQVCQGSQRAYALYDSTFQMVHPAQRNCLQQVDLAAQAVLRTAQEFSEEYELVCFARGDGADWGNELVAGAVHGSALGFSISPRSCAALIIGRLAARAKGAWLARVRSAMELHAKGVGGCLAGFCTSCYRSGLPSLCFHKSTAATAAFCIFDLRCSMHMASTIPFLCMLPPLTSPAAWCSLQ